MPEYARVVNGAVEEIRTLDSIPAHKAALWTPLAREGDGEITQTIVESNVVRIVRSNPPLDTLKARFKAKVDADAEAARLRFITPGSGMAMTYQEKHAQARAVDGLGEEAANALSEPERIDQFPTLSASVGIEAPTLWGCAQIVIARYEYFADISAVIERSRLQGKKSISDASDAAAVQAAYEAITWPSP